MADFIAKLSAGQIKSETAYLEADQPVSRPAKRLKLSAPESVPAKRAVSPPPPPVLPATASSSTNSAVEAPSVASPLRVGENVKPAARLNGHAEPTVPVGSAASTKSKVCTACIR